jgi:succinate dehydrogenase / fumarate reductase cytochrome b subunit
MHTLIKFYNSSVGKKLLVGLTGILLVAFLVIHLIGNLLLFRNDGGEAFDVYSEWLPQIVVIRIIEVLLFLMILFHIITAAYTWLINKMARNQPYDVRKPGATSPLSSRTMLLSGSIVFIFLVIHMRTFWWTSRYEAGEHFSMYNLVRNIFADPAYDILYLVALFLLGFHLHHGFQSALQTFGLREKKYVKPIEWFGIIVWLLIPLGFAVMPVFFYLTYR